MGPLRLLQLCACAFTLLMAYVGSKGVIYLWQQFYPEGFAGEEVTAVKPVNQTL